MATKSNAEYWQQRSGEEDLLRHLQDADEVIANMKGIYTEVQGELADDLAAFYGYVMTDNGFSPEEADKFIKKGRRAMKKLDYYTSTFEELGRIPPALYNKYKALATAKHITRFEILQAQIAEQLTYLAMEQEKRIGEHLEACAKDDYYSAVYAEYRKGNPGALERMAFGGVAITERTVKEVAMMNWAGATFSDAIWHREFDLSEKLARAVRRNVVQGKSLRDCAKELEEHLDDDRKYAAMRLIRTETTHVHVDMRERVLKDTGVKRYQFNAALDGRTSAICRSLHGEIFPVDEAQVGVNKPPMHPNCRSDIMAYYDSPLIEDKVYRMKMPDGKYVEIPLGQEKEAWAKIYAPDWVGTGGRKGYNKGKSDKTVSGALNPDSNEASEHAKRYYGLVRSMKNDAKRIAKNTGFKEADIKTIKKYLFVDKHDFLKTKDKRFFPSYEIAQSWQRLIDGSNIKDHDLTLLNHEILERNLIKKGLTQDEAHRMASQKYNYKKESDEYYDYLKKHKKRGR